MILFYERLHLLFSVYIAILCMAAVYNNHRRLLQFIIISAIINILLVYFRMPLSHVGTFAASSEIIVHSVLSFFSSAVVYMITRFACINGSISEFTGVVDTKACIGKPFLDLFEDAAVKLMPGEVMVV